MEFLFVFSVGDSPSPPKGNRTVELFSLNGAVFRLLVVFWNYLKILECRRSCFS